MTEALSQEEAVLQILEQELSHQLQKLNVDQKETESEEEGTDSTLMDPKSVDQLPSLDEVEEILDYQFKNKRLLEEAFTDSSYPNRRFTYERLEYVGDSVLNLLFTKEQYFMYPDLPPGSLTRLRAANVNTEKLARVAFNLGLHRYLRHNKPLLGEQIRKLKQGIAEYPLTSNGLIDVPKALADIVESTIGAVYVDCDSLDTVWKVFKNLLQPIINPETITKHPVTELYEVCQKKNMNLKFVDLWKENKAYDVFINDQRIGRGTYGMKKEIAHTRAAKNALDNIGKVIGEKDNGDDQGSVPIKEN